MHTLLSSSAIRYDRTIYASRGEEGNFLVRRRSTAPDSQGWKAKLGSQKLEIGWLLSFLEEYYAGEDIRHTQSRVPS
jgi:hypothetical protein